MASRKVKQLMEAHQKTMLKCPNFNVWVKRHLRCFDNLEDYEKAFNELHKVGVDVEETN